MSDTKLLALTEAQVKHALLAYLVTKYPGYAVEHYAMTSNGKFIVKIVKTP